MELVDESESVEEESLDVSQFHLLAALLEGGGPLDCTGGTAASRPPVASRKIKSPSIRQSISLPRPTNSHHDRLFTMRWRNVEKSAGLGFEGVRFGTH